MDKRLLRTCSTINRITAALVLPACVVAAAAQSDIPAFTKFKREMMPKVGQKITVVGTRAIYCPACGHLQQPTEKCRNEKCGADIRGVRSPLHSFRFYDCRHHSITRLCEVQANDSIIREIAGHVSPKMLAHYSHVRMSAKRKALDALSARPTQTVSDQDSEGSYGTNHGTNSVSESKANAQVFEKIGGAGGIRIRQRYGNKGVLRCSLAF